MAIVLVLMFHRYPGLIDGGFIGVNVFFLIFCFPDDTC